MARRINYTGGGRKTKLEVSKAGYIQFVIKMNKDNVSAKTKTLKQHKSPNICATYQRLKTHKKCTLFLSFHYHFILHVHVKTDHFICTK